MYDDLRNKILSYLKERSDKKATFEKLKTNFKSKDLNDTLLKMTQKGEIILSGKAYKLNQEKTKQGKVQVDKLGIKYIAYNNKKVTINSNSCYYVLEGDLVNYYIINNEAYVHDILERKLDTRPFEVIERNGKKQLEYTSGEFYFNSKNINLSEYSVGEILLVDITNSKIVRRLSNKSNPNNRDIVIAYNHGFDDYYSPKYFEELNAMKKEVTEEDLIGRVDFRNDLVYTIDCKNTGDMDDAVSVKKLPNGNYQLCCHIAAVSEYVPFLGEIYKTAAKRGTSAYSQRSVFPMYHPIISNGICSLNPGVDRLTKTLILEIDKTGQVINRKLCRSVINSKKKMEYEEVDKVYTDSEDMDSSYEPFKENLKLFREVTNIMGSYLLSHGKIELAGKDFRVIFDDNNTADKIIDLDGPLSRKSIEYAMIYTNWQWALELTENNIPMIYRNHLAKESIEKTITKLKAAGFDITTLERTGNFQSFLKTIQNDSLEYRIASDIILTSGLDSAFFATENQGHYGIGLDLYGFFSSGIRRGPDTDNGYSTDAYLTNDEKLLEKLASLETETCDWYNYREKEADCFEHESLDYDLMEIAKKNIGYEFLGIVSTVRNGLVYVKLDNGLYGTFDSVYNICVGDRVNIKIDKVNENQREIKLEFLGVIKSRKNKNKTKVRKK